MTNQHPITPPPELVQQWLTEWGVPYKPDDLYQHIAIQAARWGADQELEACAEWLKQELQQPGWANRISSYFLYAARRPNPPSLKEQALDAWDRLRNEAWCEEIDFDLDFVRRALEQLPND